MEIFKLEKKKDYYINHLGGKGESLQFLLDNDFNVPKGLIIPTCFFLKYINQNSSYEKINLILSQIDSKRQSSINIAYHKIQKILDNLKVPEDIVDEMLKEFDKLNLNSIAVRSSANVEDGKTNAWAGIFDSFLNVKRENLIEGIRKCWNSLYSQRAIFYRVKNSLIDKDIKVAVILQEMISSEISGIGFSVNPMSQDFSKIVIEACFGLGEFIVSGRVNPDSYIINKETFDVEKQIREQKIGSYFTGEIDFGPVYSKRQKLSDEKILEIANSIKRIENLYGLPVDIEFSVFQDRLYILQARPITSLDIQNNKLAYENLSDEDKDNIKHIVESEWGSFKNTKRALLPASIWVYGVQNPIKEIVDEMLVEDIEIRKIDEPPIRCFKIQEEGNFFNLKLEKQIKNPNIILKYLDEEDVLFSNVIKARDIISDAIEKDRYEDVIKYTHKIVDLYRQANFYECYVDLLLKKLICMTHDKRKIKKILNRANEWRNDRRFDWEFGIIRYVCNYIIDKFEYDINEDDIMEYVHFREFELFLDNKINIDKFKESIKTRKENGYILTNLKAKQYANQVIDIHPTRQHIEKHIYDSHAKTVDSKFDGLEIRGESILKGNIKIKAECIVVNQESDLSESVMYDDKILITTMTTPTFVPYINNVKGIITDNGGITCHAAIISREFNIPCIIGTEGATQIFKTGDLLEMDLSKGTVRKVE